MGQSRTTCLSRVCECVESVRTEQIVESRTVELYFPLQLTEEDSDHLTLLHYKGWEI